MQKVKVTAQGMLDIIKGIFADNDIDILNDEARQAFDANSIQEALNVEYYTFKYRPQSTEQILADLRERSEPANMLMGLNRAFCCFTMGNVERVFAKDIDQVVVEGVLDYWVQTSKLPLVEYLIDKANRSLTGQRLPVTFQPGNEIRKAAIVFDNPGVPDYDLKSQIGEAARISVGVMIELSLDATTYSDIEIELSFNGRDYLTVPLISWTYAYNASQVPIPMANKSDSGFINTTQSNSWNLSFYDFNKPLTKAIREVAFGCNTMNGLPVNLNIPIFLRLTDKSDEIHKVWEYAVISKSITFNVINTAFNTVSAVFAPRGV